MMKYGLLILAFFCFAPSAFASQMLIGGTQAGASATVEQNTMLNSVGNIGSFSIVNGLMPIKGSIGAVLVKLATAPGAGASRTFQLMLNEATSSAPSCTISDTDTTCSIANAGLAFVPGDRVVLADTPANSPVTTAVSTSAIIYPNTPGDILVQGRLSGNVDSAAEVFFQIAQTAALSSTLIEASTTQIMPVAGTIDRLYNTLSSVPSGGRSYTFSLRVNLASTTLADTIADSNLAANDTTHSVAVAQFDQIGMASVPLGSPTARLPATAFRFRATDPTISSIFIYSSITGFDSASSVRVAPINSERTFNVGTGSIGNTQTAMAAPLTFTTMVASSTAPGGVAKRAFFLQVNGVTTSFGCTLTGTQSTCSYNGSLRVQTGDLVNWVNTPTGSPTPGNPLLSLAARDPHGQLKIPSKGRLLIKTLGKLIFN